MLNTIRLFDIDPYASIFDAQVIYVGDDYLILDRTLFYPFSGNQHNDTGIINGKAIEMVSYDELPGGLIDFNSPVKHYMDVAGFCVGQKVRGEIDSNKRMKTMRLHSASHIVEYFISCLGSYISTEGSLVNDEKDRTDYKLSTSLTAQDLIKIECDVNEFIKDNREIHTSINDGVKKWICDPINMVCCGTHVQNTKDIGTIKLSRKNKGKGIYRVETYLLDM